MAALADRGYSYTGPILGMLFNRKANLLSSCGLHCVSQRVSIYLDMEQHAKEHAMICIHLIAKSALDLEALRVDQTQSHFLALCRPDTCTLVDQS